MFLSLFISCVILSSQGTGTLSGNNSSKSEILVIKIYIYSSMVGVYSQMNLQLLLFIYNNTLFLLPTLIEEFAMQIYKIE